MTQYLFTPPPVVSVPIRGKAETFPIRRIFCVGRNYEAHAKEMGMAVDREVPFYFTKASINYVPSGAEVVYPPGTSDYHYEMEMVVALGKAGFRIAATDALNHIYGYACGLDMTRRDLQKEAREKSRPWDVSKNFEESAVLSEIVPVAVIGHPAKGKIQLSVNGTVKQSSDIALMIHPVAALISNLSCYYHLQPGDLIFTGTPEGVGPVIAGDRIDGQIEGIGTISLKVGAPDS